MFHTTEDHRLYRHRSAFTLIEVLVVLAIIATLVALTAGTYFRLMGTGQLGANKAALAKVQKLLKGQYQTVRDQALKEALPPTTPALRTIYDSVLAMAGSDPARARVIWVKLRLKQAFPTTFAEALTPSPMPSLYTQRLASYGVTGPNASPAAYESSACLLLALQRGVGGGGASEEVGKSITQSFPTAGGSIPALVEPYGTPFAFCRWPTGSVDLNPGGAQNGQTNDPEDPNGYLSNTAWITQYGAQFATYCHALPTTAGTSYKLRPLVVSAGEDRKLGLDPATFTPTSLPDTYDNVVAQP